MRNQNILILACLVLGCGLLLVGCSQVENFLPASKNDSEESSEVYSAVINELFADLHAPNLAISTRAICVNSPEFLTKTSFEERVKSSQERYRDAERKTVESYQTKYDEPASITDSLNLKLSRPYSTQNEGELDNVNDIQAMNHFYDKHPGASGMIRLSRVGFNRARTEALVEIELIYCPLCSFGQTVLLRKMMGVWKIQEKYGGWVS